MRERLQNLSFSLREWLRSSPPVRLKAISFNRWLEPQPLPSQNRAKQLAKQFDLSRCAVTCNALCWSESLYVLDVLAQHVDVKSLPEGRHLDVGSKNGSYLPGLDAFLPHWDGVELDAHRRYLNFTTRRAHAEAMAKPLQDTRFIANSVSSLHGPYSLITWFLPFLFPEPHHAWGLPAHFFKPRETMQKVFDLLSPSGQLLILNQGETEASEQASLLKSLGIPFESLGEIQSPVSPFRKKRLGFRVSKTA